MDNTGIQTGIVADNKDPEQRGRIKITLPSDFDNTGTLWARVVQSLAGDQYGTYFLPEIGDEVLVGFENNNHSYPIILGCLYNGQKKQPAAYDANNYIKNIKTKAGNEINFNDTPGSEQITITNKTTNDNQVILTVSDSGKITITSNGKIVLTAPEIDLNANSKLNLAGGEVNISGSKISLNSQGDVAISGQGKVTADGATGVALSTTGGDVTMSGMNVSGTGQVGVTMKGNATAELSASGMTTIKGGMVMIN